MLYRLLVSILVASGVLENEIENGLWVFQAMGMVAAVFFVNDLNLTTECSVSFFDDGCVFGDGNGGVGITDDVDKRDLRLSEGFELIDRVAFEAHGLLFSESVNFQAALPVAIRSDSFKLPAWPAFDIADWCIGIDTGNLVWVGGCPVEDD